MFELLLRPTILVPAAVFLAYLISQLLRSPPLPDLPIVGAKDDDWFPVFQAKLRNTFNYKRNVRDAYIQYKDQSYIMPMLHCVYVVLPRAEAEWYISQPDSVLDFHAASSSTLQLEYTAMEPSLSHDTGSNRLITLNMTGQLGALLPAIADEVRAAVDGLWDVAPGEEGELCVFETMIRVVTRVTNRVFVGAPLCHNQELLDLSMALAQDLPVAAQIINHTWAPLVPLTAAVATLPSKIRGYRYKRIIGPEVRRRLAAYDARAADPEGKTGADEPEPNDFLQWAIRQAKESGDPRMWSLNLLAGRVLLLNFAAIHTSSFNLTSALLELAASDPDHVRQLREEIETVLAAHGGVWSKRAAAEMEKLDSLFRESARLNSFMTLGIARQVAAADGVTTPSGVHVARGTMVCIPSYGVLLDDEVYPDAGAFRPFRFAEARHDETASYVERARNAFATTKPEFLAFGHGRHACPGRFFASLELKLIMAYLLVNYDIAPRDRPGNKWYAMNRMPDVQATLRVRRRREGVDAGDAGEKESS